MTEKMWEWRDVWKSSHKNKLSWWTRTWPHLIQHWWRTIEIPRLLFCINSLQMANELTPANSHLILLYSVKRFNCSFLWKGSQQNKFLPGLPASYWHYAKVSKNVFSIWFVIEICNWSFYRHDLLLLLLQTLLNHFLWHCIVKLNNWFFALFSRWLFF